jgi:putative ABC transport system permease protein
MLQNYLIISWRNLLRNRRFSLLNITGLAIGLAVSFLIYQYVQFERSYDRFHQYAGRLYRVPIAYAGSFASIGTSATTHPALGPALQADFPEVQAFARLVRASLFINTPSLAYTDNRGQEVAFNEKRLYAADSSFLTLFSYPLLVGTPARTLQAPNSVVLTERTARKYFGNQPALGKTLRLNGEANLTVTGVLKDLPPNSHLQFDALLSFSSLESLGKDRFRIAGNWTWPEFYTYVLLAPGADPGKLERKLPAFTEKYMSAIFRENKFTSRFFLQPVTDIHLHSHFLYEQDVNGSERTVYFLVLLGVFVTAIAWVNYVNLSTAKSLERAKEVGLRKVAGASKSQLVVQFFFDAFLINVLAVGLAGGLLLLSAPYVETLVGKDIFRLLLTPGPQQTPSLWLIAGGVTLLGTLLTGLYPALLLSSFQPILVLKGSLYKSPSGVLLRRVLVTFQYSLSVFLLAGTFTLYRQLSFMQNQDLGYAKDQVLVLQAPATYDSTLSGRIAYFGQQLRQLPAVGRMTASDDVPGHTMTDRNTIRRAEHTAERNFNTYIQAVDTAFFSTYRIGLVAGRGFRATERFGFGRPNQVLINEEVSKRLGYARPEDALHQRIVSRIHGVEYTGEVVGIVKNYHQVSLKENYDPILYFYPEWEQWKYLSLQVDTRDLSRTIASVKALYGKAFPHNAFEYFFLDEYFDQQYQAEQRLAALLGLFTGLAVLIACLGLVGLSVFAAGQRQKEMGIRKVLGASVTGILLLFSRESLRLILLACLIALPLVYLAAASWLNNFAFHITIGWQILMLPPILLVILSLGTIILVCWKAAGTNPSEALRQQ